MRCRSFPKSFPLRIRDIAGSHGGEERRGSLSFRLNTIVQSNFLETKSVELPSIFSLNWRQRDRKWRSSGGDELGLHGGGLRGRHGVRAGEPSRLGESLSRHLLCSVSNSVFYGQKGRLQVSRF